MRAVREVRGKPRRPRREGTGVQRKRARVCDGNASLALPLFIKG
jgi:hypothetical protein